MIKRSVIITLEFFASILAIAALLIALLIFRLAQGPIAMPEIGPYLADIFSNPKTGVRAEVPVASLSWDKESTHFEWLMQDVRLKDSNFQTIAHLPRVEVRISLLGLLLGRFLPSELTLLEPKFNLQRDATGAISFPLFASAKDNDPGPDWAGFVHDALIANTEESGWFVVLSHISVQNGQVQIFDVNGHIFNATIEELNLNLDRTGLTGSLRVKSDGAYLQTTLNTVRMPTSLDFVANFSGVRPPILANFVPGFEALARLNLPLAGQIKLRLFPDLKALNADVQIKSEGAGALALQPAPEPPLAINALSLAFSYDEKGMELKESVIDWAGPQLSLSGKGEQTEQGYRAVLQAELQDMTLADLPRYWPADAAPNARSWVLENVQKGDIKKTIGSFGLSWSKLTGLRMDELAMTAQLQGATVRYFAPLPLLTDVAAELRFTPQTLSIELKSGKIADINVVSGKGFIDGLDVEDQTMRITADTSGPLAEYLRIIDLPPLGYTSLLDVKAADFSGKATAQLNISFPLLSDLLFEQVQLEAKATLNDIDNSTLVPGLQLTGGPLRLTVTPDGMDIIGTATINGAPTDLTWRENFSDALIAQDGFISNGVGQAVIQAKLLPRFGLPFADFTSGEALAKVAYKRAPAKASELSIDADIKNLAIDWSLLNIRKEKGQAGNVQGVLSIPKDAELSLPNLRVNFGNNSSAEIALRFSPQWNLLSLDVQKAQTDNNQLNASLRPLAQGGWAGNIFASKLDLSRWSEFAKSGDPNAPTAPLDLTIQGKNVSFGEARALNELVAKLQRNDKGWQHLEIDGKTLENVPITVKIRPEAGRMRLFANTPNLGAVLRAINLSDTVEGGLLTAEGAAVSAAPDAFIAGRLQLEEYRLRQLPALAVLVTAAFPLALPDLMGGDGIGFQRLDGVFNWRNQGVVDDVELKETRMSGLSLGISAEGIIDFAKNDVRLQGTVVPANLVSEVLGAIPLFGRLLTGGDGVFAVTYTMTGPLDDLKTSVNPAALLAPGFLRNMFFVDDKPKRDDDKKVPAKTDAPVPVVPAPAAPNTAPPQQDTPKQDTPAPVAPATKPAN